MYHLIQMLAWLRITESWQVLLSLKQELFDTTKPAKEFDFPSASPSFCLWAIPEFWREVEVTLPNSSSPYIFTVFSALQKKKHLAFMKIKRSKAERIGVIFHNYLPDNLKVLFFSQ